MPLFSFDTETFLICPGVQAPPLVCVQYAWGNEPSELIHVRDPACRRAVVSGLEKGLLNAHNLAFDACVLMAQWPDLVPLVFQCFDEDRATCTILRQKLCDIARGRFKWSSKRGYDLASVARTLKLPLELNKEDVYRLRYGTLIDVPVANWPEDARRYALDDVEAQRLVWAAQEQYAAERDIPLIDQYRQARAALWLRLMECRGVMVDPVRVEEYISNVRATLDVDREICEEHGLVYGPNHCPKGKKFGSKDTRAAMRWMASVCRQAEEDDLPLTDTGEESVRAFLGLEENAPIPRGATWRWWASMAEDKVEGVSLNEDSVQLYGDEVLEAYGRYATASNQVTRAERLAVASRRGLPIQASFGVLQDTGRTSCSQGDKKKGKQDLAPSALGAQLQNPAKDKKVKRKCPAGWVERDDHFFDPVTGESRPRIFLRKGPRELFVPREDHWLCSTDYDSMELCGVGYVCLKKVGFSRLVEVINEGRDAHTELGATLAGISTAEAYARRKGERGPELKKEFDDQYRQSAKIGNFGFWGGMGPAKLALQARKQYGVILGATPSNTNPTAADVLAAAKRLREAWFATWPEAHSYLRKWVPSQLSGPDGEETGEFLQLWSGRKRGGCWYSALANTTFQGLCADIKKHAFWRISQEMYTGRSPVPSPGGWVSAGGMSPLYRSRLLIDVHDEALTELVIATAHEAGYRQAEIQVEVAKEIAPGVRWSCSPAWMECWYKGAETVHRAGRAIPWRPGIKVGKDLEVIEERMAT